MAFSHFHDTTVNNSGLVISYKYSIEMATGFMIISTIASIIIKYIKDKE